MGVSSVTISQRNGRTEIYSSYGWVKTSCSATLPSNSSGSESRTKYSKLRYAWSFYKNNSSTAYYSTAKQSNNTYIHNCTNSGGTGILSPGKKNQIKVKVKVTCTQTKEKKVEGKWVADGTPNDNYSVGELTSANVNLFTRNSASSTDFWGNPSAGDYIYQHITQKNVNAWIDQLGIWKSWKEQSDYYDTYDTHKNPTGDIKASWYNTLAGYCGANTVTGLSDVTDKSKATHIAASHFIILARKVTTWT